MTYVRFKPGFKISLNYCCRSWSE